MGKRGPRSSADLATRPLPDLSRRPSAVPATLMETEAVIWEETVACMPSGWLTKAQMPLLTAYCRHAARSDLLATQVNKFRPAWLKAEGGVERFGKLLTMAREETKAMTAMARALRLTPQAMYGPRKAHTINAEASDGPRPWD